MARSAKRPCTYPGCGVLTETGRCAKHAYVEKQQHDATRGNRHERGYDNAWARYSAARLRKHPLCECEQCKAGELRVMVATITDHKVPHRGDRKLFWDTANHQSMAKACHDRKTAAEDGGFGNARGGRGQKSLT
jgi:5-methylcytosine-specific restriction protein A